MLCLVLSLSIAQDLSADYGTDSETNQVADSHLASAPRGTAIENSHDDDSIHSAVKQSMRSSVQRNWYDSKSEQLVRPQFSAAKEAQKPSDVEWPKRTSRRRAPPGLSGTGGNGWVVPVGIIAGLILIGLIALAYRFRGIRGLVAFQARRVQVESVPARAVELPFELPQTQEGLLGLARRLADEGKYHQAIIPLYGYYLLHLDFHGRIRLSKGKTNRQYLRELKGAQPLATILLDSILVFERAFFGGQMISRDDFEACWAHLDPLHQNALLAEESRHVAVES